MEPRRAELAQPILHGSVGPVNCVSVQYRVKAGVRRTACRGDTAQGRAGFKPAPTSAEMRGRWVRES